MTITEKERGYMEKKAIIAGWRDKASLCADMARRAKATAERLQWEISATYWNGLADGMEQGMRLDEGLSLTVRTMSL